MIFKLGKLQEKIMDDETLKHLLALKQTNEAILDGLKTAIYLLDNEDKFTPERRESLVAQLKELALAGEAVFKVDGEDIVKH